MRRISWLFPLAAVGLMACQTELYPEAPDPALPSSSWQSSSASPSSLPSAGGVPESRYGGQVVAAGTRYFEFFTFASANNAGAQVWGLLPLDATGLPLAVGTPMNGTLQVTPKSGAAVTKTLKASLTTDPPFLYLIPTSSGLAAGQTYQVHAEFTAAGQSYSADLSAAIP